MNTSLTEELAALKQDDYATLAIENQDFVLNTFEFTADLTIELPTHLDPSRFFDDFVRVMIAHTETYDGFIGGGTKWSMYEVDENE